MRSGAHTTTALKVNMTEDNAHNTTNNVNDTDEQSTEPRETVKFRIPGHTATNTDSEISVANRKLIAIAWHKHGGIGDGLEVYAGNNTDDELVIMRDILGHNAETGEDILGEPFTVSAENMTDYVFVAPDGDDLTVESVMALARHQIKQN